jgi:hypothetical protein
LDQAAILFLAGAQRRLGAPALGHIVVRFEDRSGPALRIAIKRPACAVDDDGPVLARMAQFSDPTPVSVQPSNLIQRL